VSGGRGERGWAYRRCVCVLQAALRRAGQALQGDSPAMLFGVV
jgi:hypothetical protein